MKKLSKISDFLVQTFGFFLSARKISHKDNTVQVVAKKKKKQDCKMLLKLAFLECQFCIFYHDFHIRYLGLKFCKNWQILLKYSPEKIQIFLIFFLHFVSSNFIVH